MDQSYKELRDDWYAMLSALGFKDIEDVDSPREMLNHWDSFWFRSNFTATEFQEKQQYFEMTVAFLHCHTFNSADEEQVWMLHSDGYSYIEIAERLRTEENKMNKDKVNKIISKLSRAMRGFGGG